MGAQSNYVLFGCTFISIIGLGACIQCFQCDSNEDKSCPSYRVFDRNLNALVDCNSFEAKIPGTFCMKISQQSPGWGNWKKITRRCGSRSEQGVAWGCQWDFEENGVWKEICYCEDRDGCNGASSSYFSHMVVTLCIGVAFLLKSWH